MATIEITISGKTTSRVGTQGKVVEDRSFPSNEWRNLWVGISTNTAQQLCLPKSYVDVLLLLLVRLHFSLNTYYSLLHGHFALFLHFSQNHCHNLSLPIQSLRHGYHHRRPFYQGGSRRHCRRRKSGQGLAGHGHRPRPPRSPRRVRTTQFRGPHFCVHEERWSWICASIYTFF